VGKRRERAANKKGFKEIVERKEYQKISGMG
jgi:hypothetical protein